METVSKSVWTVITITVGIIMLAALVVPLIQDYQSDHTYTYYNANTNVVRATLVDIDPTEEYDLSFEVIDSVLNVKIDDTYYPLSRYAIGFASDCINVRSYGSSYLVNLVSGNQGNWTGSFTMSISNGTATITHSSNTYTFPITWFAYQNSEGDHVTMLAESASRVIYYTDINNVRGANWISTTSEWYSFKGLDVTVGDTEITATLQNVKTLSGDGHSFVYSATVGDYTFNVDNDGEDYTVYPWVYVTDYKVVAITNANQSQFNILSAIPAVFIAAFIMILVRAYKMDD